MNPLNDVSAVSSIDNLINLKDVFGKVDKLGEVCDRGQDDASLIRYITGVSNVSRQGEIFNIVPKKAYAIATYVDKRTLEFTIELAANTLTNYSNMCIVLPITIRQSTNKAQNVDVITVNNFFVID